MAKEERGRRARPGVGDTGQARESEQVEEGEGRFEKVSQVDLVERRDAAARRGGMHTSDSGGQEGRTCTDKALGAVGDRRVDAVEGRLLVRVQDVDARQRGDVRDVVHLLKRRLRGRVVEEGLGRKEAADEALLVRLERVERVCISLGAVRRLRSRASAGYPGRRRSTRRRSSTGCDPSEKERPVRTWQMRSLRTMRTPRPCEAGDTAVVTASRRLLCAQVRVRELVLACAGRAGRDAPDRRPRWPSQDAWRRRRRPSCRR